MDDGDISCTIELAAAESTDTVYTGVDPEALSAIFRDVLFVTTSHLRKLVPGGMVTECRLG